MGIGSKDSAVHTVRHGARRASGRSDNFPARQFSGNDAHGYFVCPLKNFPKESRKIRRGISSMPPRGSLPS